MPFSSACLQDVSHPFASRANGLKLRRVQDLLHRLGSGQCVHHVFGVRAEHRFHHVVSISIHLAQIKFQPLSE